MGALESNAGDDFHFWWAASRALALIEPGTQSRLLLVEGLAPIDDPNDEYEIADVTEYIGGDDVTSAETVRISQLKYSTRHPDRAWTAARLAQERGRPRKDSASKMMRSVARDLAETYRQLVTNHGRDVVLPRIQLQLVSNQPVDPLLQSSVTAAAEWTRDQGVTARRHAMLRALPDSSRAVVQQLAESIGQRLSSQEFCDFLTTLDFSHTGTFDRAALVRSVRLGASGVSPGRGTDTSQRLFDLVRRQALPESQRRGIRAADVLAELGVAELQDIYPAPSRLAELTDPLPAPGVDAVAGAATFHLGKVIVAHGPAGAGKTTALRQVLNHLAARSVLVFYDCYGGGEYLSSGEERHTPQRFVMQVVNDLAQQCGIPLLLHPHQLDEDLWRHFSRALSRAADTLAPDAILVVAVDAADNAAVAAGERGDRSFLPGLLGLPLPPRVTVVLTARSHRVAILGAARAPTVTVVPFNAETSIAYLRQHRPEISDADADEFHQRTDGNPRVQFYILEQAASCRWNTTELLAACTRTPEPLFAELVDSALRGSGTGTNGQRWLGLMLALARPVRIGTLADALEVDIAAVSAFADGLAPGVQVLRGTIQFRDEDFETYVRDQVDLRDVLTAHGRLADLFMARRIEDADAAAHVAEHLFAAARFEELLKLVLEEDSPRGIADGLRREQVQGRRLDLAARAAARGDDAAVAVRIAARGCDTASRVDTLTRLVESHLELVSQYADVDLLRAYALQQDHDTWLGPLYMRLAAALSRDPERQAAAREALESADAWVRRWVAGQENETRHWRLETDDVASAAEATFRLDGGKAAIAWLRRWRPASFALDAAAILAARVAGEVSPGEIWAALKTGHVPATAQAPFLAYASSPTVSPDPGWIDTVVTALVTSTPYEFELWHSRLLDAVVRHGSREKSGDLADHWKRDLPAFAWSFRTRDSEGVSGLLCHAVAAALAGRDLDVDALVPASLQRRETKNGGTDDQRGRERGEWTRTVGSLGPMALLAARAAIGDSVRDSVISAVDSGLADRLEKARHRWFKYDTSFRAWASLAAEAIADAGAPVDLLDQLAEAAPKLMRGSAPELLLDIAEVLTPRPIYRDRAGDLCVNASAAARAGTYPALDRLELLARAAEIASRINPALGRQLFERAVDAATGINDDAARLLSVHADLACRATLAPDERAQTAARLVRATEQVAPHVTDSDVVPYKAIAGASAHLAVEVGLAAVSRWDDEARVAAATTLPEALLGAIDGGGILAGDALLLDHLIDDDSARLTFQLAVVERMPRDAAGNIAARLALTRAARWLRHNVPACSQPKLARRLLDVVTQRGADAAVRADLAAIAELVTQDQGAQPTTSRQWAHEDPPQGVQALLTAPTARDWVTLAEDVGVLTDALVYGERLQAFVTDVLQATPPAQRLDALAALAAVTGRQSSATVLPVLADLVGRWSEWPGIREWGAAALPDLMTRFLTDLLAYPVDVGPLVAQLRALADDATIRRAVLDALPESRPRITAQGWQNIAAVLGRLCGPSDAANALVGLLTDRTNRGLDEHCDPVAVANDPGAVTMLLWSTLGHPKREVRWRAIHALRELLVRLNPTRAADLTARMIGRVDADHIGQYRSDELPFYQLSAVAALLTTLGRIADERPVLLVPHIQFLSQIATSRELPHAQIRELARLAALAVGEYLGSEPRNLEHANRPVASTASISRQVNPARKSPNVRRYRFDETDTIPYWYMPLARLFEVDLSAITDRAERWILDIWGHAEDDWIFDARELRDERSWGRSHNDHGAIPPDENLRLYLEYHAMLVVAGELIDAGRPVQSRPEWDTLNSWDHWIQQHLPADSRMWISDLRSPVPVEPALFGHLPPLEEWEIADSIEYDDALELLNGGLTQAVIVAATTNVTRSDAYGYTHVSSALVSTDRAADLQQALSAAINPTDYRLPHEEEEGFEINFGPFVLLGWLTGPPDKPESLDEHDPYATGLYRALTLPGRRFRDCTGVLPDPTKLALSDANGAILARAEQWADAGSENPEVVTSSGFRLRIERAALLNHLSETGTNLIVEVQIGRNRSNRRSTEDYRFPQRRIYLIDATGRVTVR